MERVWTGFTTTYIYGSVFDIDEEETLPGNRNSFNAMCWSAVIYIFFIFISVWF